MFVCLFVRSFVSACMPVCKQQERQGTVSGEGVVAGVHGHRGDDGAHARHGLLAQRALAGGHLESTGEAALQKDQAIQQL